MELKIDLKKSGEQITTLDLKGEMDVFTSPKLKETVVNELSSGQRYIVIKMHKVNYMDSAGLAILVGVLKRSREHEGDVFLVAPHKRIMKILDVTDLNAAFSICDTEEEALMRIGLRRKRKT